MKSKKKFDTFEIVVMHDLAILILGIIFYALIPILLNYGPETINSYFETQIDSGYYYYVQYTMVIFAVMVIDTIFVISQVKGVDQWEELNNRTDEKNIKMISKIKDKCFRIPHILYISQLIIFPLMILLVLYVTGAKSSLIVKIMSIIFTFVTLSSIIAYIFTKNILKKVLISIKLFK